MTNDLKNRKVVEETITVLNKCILSHFSKEDCKVLKLELEKNSTLPVLTAVKLTLLFS